MAGCNFRVHGGAMRIRKLGVVGAGTMGAGISALAASAGIPVVLLDIAGKDGDRNAPARGGLERMKKSKPAAFMDVDRAARDRDRQPRRRSREARRLRSRRRSDHRAARAEAGALRASREAAAGAHDRRVEHVGHSDEAADARAQRVVEAALPRHALLQSAALSPSARDHPDAATRRRRRSTPRASSAIASSARASSSRRTFRVSSPTGSACSAWCSPSIRWRSTTSRSTTWTCSPVC